MYWRERETERRKEIGERGRREREEEYATWVRLAPTLQGMRESIWHVLNE